MNDNGAVNFGDVVRIIREEAGQTVAEKIELRLRREMGGSRVTIYKRARVTAEDLHAAAPGKPELAAKKLGINRSTAYKIIRSRRIIR